MTDQVNIYGLIRDAIATYPANSDETVAIEVLNRLKVRVAAAKVLQPLVENAVAAHRRGETRHTERAAFSRPWSSPRQLLNDATPVDVMDARNELLASGFFTVDGRRVEWAKATIDDHEARIGALRAHVAGVQRTISAHEQAVAAIKAAGVTCLAEIEGAA